MRLSVLDGICARKSVEQIVNGAILLNQHDDVFNFTAWRIGHRLDVRRRYGGRADAVGA